MPRPLDENGNPVDDQERLVEVYGHQNRWQGDQMPPKQRQFLTEWCMVYPRPCTQAEYARRINVSVRTLQNWLNDPRFRAVWREEADNAYASPEWTMPLIAETYRLALNEPDRDGNRAVSASDQLRAIAEFAKFVDMTTPTRVEHTIVPLDKELEQMDVAELTRIAEGIVIDVDSYEVDDDNWDD